MACGCYGCKHDVVSSDPNSWPDGICHISGIDCTNLQCEDCKIKIIELDCFEPKEEKS